MLSTSARPSSRPAQNRSSAEGAHPQPGRELPDDGGPSTHRGNSPPSFPAGSGSSVSTNHDRHHSSLPVFYSRRPNPRLLKPASSPLMSTTLLALLSSAALVAAHGDEDMSMPGMGDMPEGSHDEAMSMGMMMWFHFTRGDNLLFKEWAPKAAGAFAGACIALVVLAMVDRFLAAIRAAAEAKWAYQAQHAAPITSSTYNDFSPAPLTSTANKDTSSTAAADLPPRVRDVFHTRGPSPAWVQPRNIGRDALRGVLHGVQGGLGLILMLAVMSFNVWFLLSVVVGLALGEFAFGRFSASNARQGGASGAQGCC